MARIPGRPRFVAGQILAGWRWLSYATNGLTSRPRHCKGRSCVFGPFSGGEFLVIDATRLYLTPYAPADLLALIEGPAQFAASFGLPAADGLRDFFVSGDVSPAWLVHLRAASAADPWQFGYAVVDRAARTVIGNVGFKGPPDAGGVVEIAYAIVPSFQQRGYATEAVQAALPWVNSDQRVSLLRAHTLPTNRASSRVLEKCGFRFLDEVIDPDDGLVARWERSKETA